MFSSNKVYKGVVTLLFLMVFIYLLLRIIYNEPLHDEIATYMFYFYYGNYIGENIHWDANNHLLNSFIGHNLYKLFGENIAVLRAPNLLAFILYFFGSYQLIKPLKRQSLKLLAIISLNTIPFVIEYFGNMRGYGLSLGFFLWALIYLHHYSKTLKIRSLIYTYLFLILTVSANLTFINSSLIILFLSILSPFFAQKKKVLSNTLKTYTIHFLFCIALAPFIYFGLLLKNHGALYYGSLDGLWEVTGRTLSQYTLFYSKDWIKYIYILIFLGFGLFGAQLLKNVPKKKWIQQAYIQYGIIFFGNLAGIIILAFLLKVNYPEDRTGMYLIILFLLMVFSVLDNVNWGIVAQWLLLFFPVSFLFHLSLHTSVFSPDDRMNAKFFNKIKREIKPEHSIMIYRIMNWNWPFSESHYKQKASVAQFFDHNTILTDWVITKTTEFDNYKILDLYDTIASHLPSTYIAYKRKIPLLKKTLDSISTSNYKGSSEFYTIADFNCEKFSGKNIQISTKAHLKSFVRKNALQLIVAVSDTNNISTRYLYYDFGTTYQGKVIDDNYWHHFLLDNISASEKEIKVYIWNRNHETYEITNIRTELVELNTPKNEP